jgi:hypothetical protein
MIMDLNCACPSSCAFSPHHSSHIPDPAASPSRLPPFFQFTVDELSAITPQDLITWMTFKLYNKETADEDEVPLRGSHNSIDFYKKSISYFMPQKDQKWDSISNRGNPTRSKEVNAFINKIKEIDIKSGGSRKRKSLAGDMEDDSTSGVTDTPANTSMKMKEGQLAIPPCVKEGVHGMLQRMHAQNVTLINSFNTMSNAIDNMKRTLQTNNLAIIAEIAKLPSTTENSSAATRLVDLSNVSEGAAVDATKINVFGFDPDVAFDSESLGWHYVHPDGAKRRVPPSWQFPLGNIEEMYILWHCGDIQNRNAPMRLLTTADVAFLGKRAKISLRDLRYLINIVDEEATRKGKAPAATSMTRGHAMTSFHAGISALHCCVASVTPGGRQRNIMRMKWTTLMSSVKSGNTSVKSNEEAEETARRELVSPSPNDVPGDQWWYMHADGIKRRVPSTYIFPMLSIEEMYVIWHCGIPDQKISPMRLFNAKDLSALADRSRKNLSEVRTLMSRIDAEASRQGVVPPTSSMTVDYARQCCRSGLAGLNFQSTTLSGRARDVGQMKWSSVARNKDVKQSHQDEDEEEKDVNEDENEDEDEA